MVDLALRLTPLNFSSILTIYILRFNSMVNDDMMSAILGIVPDHRSQESERASRNKKSAQVAMELNCKCSPPIGERSLIWSIGVGLQFTPTKTFVRKQNLSQLHGAHERNQPFCTLRGCGRTPNICRNTKISYFSKKAKQKLEKYLDNILPFM